MLNLNSKKFFSSVLVFSFRVNEIQSFPLQNSRAESSYMVNSQFGIALIILGFIFLILGIIIFTLVCSCICCLFENNSLCENDSLCQFFNRDFKIKDKKTEIFSLDSELSKHKKNQDSIKTPLFESVKAMDFYGTKSEDSNETINSANNINDYYFNRLNPTLDSFRKYPQKEIQESENLNQYTKCLTINLLSNTKHDLLESQLNDLENIEKHLSKSLSELNELHKKLCLDNSLEIERNYSTEIK